ncbi:class I SAM-dependent methyltransferase [Prochlorococcus marinus]|uniref:class I SAM-dependent methyltransferase n=1 Tax=Prochlorococcus marinus TaxID=1219 RepID=UPI0007B33FAC|nr:class I SAM-dependent methyltransferase [Prochlorococcus marinus]KZR73693.1 putative S-adenosylmethionine-dependent methyltransferase/MSMEI_2290 [Prochlorococcus marinus str. MIT 1320]
MDVIKANQIIHGELAKTGEYDNSPHFYPENIQAVTSLFLDFLADQKLDSSYLLSNCLDLGCGTGFMFGILEKLGAGDLQGIDITAEMLATCIEKYPQANVKLAKAESVPCDDHTFSMITNYSFLDHVEDVKSVFKEAYRLLSPGGVFYSGLIPNLDYSNNIKKSSNSKALYLGSQGNMFLEKEHRSIFNNGQVYQDKFGLDAQLLRQAEPQKTNHNGLSIDKLSIFLDEAGFGKVYFCPNWFYNQAAYKKQIEKVKVINDFLIACGAFGLGMFKYYDFFALK